MASFQELSAMRTRQSDFWIVFAVLVFVQCNCFGQVLSQPDLNHVRIDRYDNFIKEERWSDALEILQTFDPSEIPGYHVRLCILKAEYEEANRLVESGQVAVVDAWSLAALGWWYIDKSPSKSRTYLTQSLDLEPSPHATEGAIALAHQRKDIRFAMESLRKLYKRYPSCMGGYAIDIGLQLDEADRKHGSDQVTRACKDRPQLAPFINGSARVQKWLIQRFGGTFIGRRAVWSNSLPNGVTKCDFGACHTPATSFADAAIWVDPELDGEQQFAALVYELLNAENSEETIELYAKVWGCRIDKESFVREQAKLEHRALLKRTAFFFVEYFSGGLTDSVSMDPWFLHVPPDFEEYFKEQSELLSEHYADYYDSVQEFKNNTRVENIKGVECNRQPGS